MRRNRYRPKSEYGYGFVLSQLRMARTLAGFMQIASAYSMDLRFHQSDVAMAIGVAKAEMPWLT